MAYITKSLTIVITLVSLCKTVLLSSYEYSYNPYAKEYTRNINLKQGVLRGVIVEPKIDREDVYRVGVYRGIPYAAPPVGDLRFMPTAGAPSWFGVKYADTFGPVCPQKFPDERKMPSFRKEYFLKLKSYLQNQSEDCLYLNIYAPITDDENSLHRHVAHENFIEEDCILKELCKKNNSNYLNLKRKKNEIKIKFLQILEATTSLEELEIVDKAIAPIPPTIAALVNSASSQNINIPHNKKINTWKRLFCTTKKKKISKSGVCKPSHKEVEKIALNLASKNV